jgi:hypothetical protein
MRPVNPHPFMYSDMPEDPMFADISEAMLADAPEEALSSEAALLAWLASNARG